MEEGERVRVCVCVCGVCVYVIQREKEREGKKEGTCVCEGICAVFQTTVHFFVNMSYL